MADGSTIALIRPPSRSAPLGLVRAEPTEPRVVWTPLQGSQELVLSCPCNEILYEGTRGPGKTDTQLMKFRRNVGIGYGEHWKGVIFDREYKNLDDLISKSMRWFLRMGDGAKFLSSKSDLRWVWPTGEELLFRQIKKLTDYWKYHGQEFPFIGWNELTKYPTPDLYDMMKSCNRSSFIPGENPIYIEDNPAPQFLPEIPLIVMATTNPYGAGHTWVKQRFIDTAEPGVVQLRKISVFNPRTQRREIITKSVVRLFGSYKENRYLAPEYIAELESMQDPNKRRAWLWGDWDIVAGGALSDVWGEYIKVPRFRVPERWKIDRSFDWGSTHPFSVGWWAEANGEEVTLPDGRKWAPKKGSIIRIHEWYGTEGIGSNRGLRLSAKNIAITIKLTEEKLRAEKWIAGKVYAGPADNQIGNVIESDTPTIKTQMASHGVMWTDSDKGPGTRKIGLQLMRDRCEASKTGEGPGFYVMTHCRAALALLPVLPRDEKDPDDVDTTSEDHPWDDTRYRILAGRRVTKVGALRG